MRATINLETKTMNNLLATTHLKNRSKAIRLAIEEFLRKEKLKKINFLRGQVSFDKKILSLRHESR